jgi:hypothetical protein
MRSRQRGLLAELRLCDGWRTSATTIPMARPLLSGRRTWMPLVGPLWWRPRPWTGTALPWPRGGGAVVVVKPSPPTVLQRHPHPSLPSCPCTNGLALCRPSVSLCTNAMGKGVGSRPRVAATVIVVCVAPSPKRTPGDLRRRRAPTLRMRLLNATSLGRPRLSTATTSHLFRAVGVGTIVPRLDRCLPRSSASASTVWRGATSLHDAPSLPAAFSALARSTGRGTATTTARPAAFPWSSQGVALSVVRLETTLARVDAVVAALAMMSTTAPMAR